uniref:Thiamine-phosphate pyrophosphorylase n=1 Tax=candidate division WOR-3 bacterium TaxID=2052148 RepID=A0A7C1NDF4_UNCW3
MQPNRQPEFSSQQARIVDANINRLTEGLRVIEDIIRFGLEDEPLLVRIRNLRTRLSRRIAPLRRSVIPARSSESDPGRADRFDRMKRRNLEDVLTANFKRAEESARVLEEMFKLERTRDRRQYVSFFKQLRFTLYSLEKLTLTRLERLRA